MVQPIFKKKPLALPLKEKLQAVVATAPTDADE
jgi:hypothetical protein